MKRRHDAGSSPLGRGWQLFLILLAIYTVVIVIVVAVRTRGIEPADNYETVRAKTTSDFRDYWFTGRHFRQTGEISTQFGVQNYLPFFTIFMSPWSLLPLPVAAALFSVLSMGLLALAVIMTQMLLERHMGPEPTGATLVALALMFAYIHAGAVLGTVGLLVMFLVVATWFFFEHGREWEAGGMLGLAALIKVVPAALIVFFLLKRRWRTAGTAAVVMIVLGAGLPWAALGHRKALGAHRQFYEEAVNQHSAWATIFSDQPHKLYFKNAALPALLRRLLTAPSEQRRADVDVHMADLPRSAVFAIYATILAALAGVSVFTAVRGRLHPDMDDGQRAAVQAQFGVWCSLILLASPLLWIHYLPMAYWALAVVVERAQGARRASDRRFRSLAAALAIWLVGVILLAWPAARAAGAQSLAILCLWLTLVVLSLRVHPRMNTSVIRTNSGISTSPE